MGVWWQEVGQTIGQEFSGIWLTAAIGVAAGMGREAKAVLCTVLAMVILYTVPKVARRFENHGS